MGASSKRQLGWQPDPPSRPSQGVSPARPRCPASIWPNPLLLLCSCHASTHPSILLITYSSNLCFHPSAPAREVTTPQAKSTAAVVLLLLLRMLPFRALINLKGEDKKKSPFIICFLIPLVSVFPFFLTPPLVVFLFSPALKASITLRANDKIMVCL